MATHQVLVCLYNSFPSETREGKLHKSIGFDLEQKFEKLVKNQVKSANLFDVKKKKSVSLKYHEAFSLHFLLIELFFLADNTYKKLQVQKMINEIDKVLM